MEKSFLCLRIALVMFAACAFVEVAAQTPDTRWYDDAESKTNTYWISTAEELGGLAKLVNGGTDFHGKTVALKEDIDLTKWGGEGGSWTPIGGGDVPFSGTFNGNGKKVYGLNMFIYNGNSHFQGLFGYVVNGVVRNVGVVDLNIHGDWYVGGVVAYLVNGTVDSCYSSGCIFGNRLVGGIVGDAVGSTVQYCYSSARVLGLWYAGGVVGGVNDGSAVINCYSTGDIGNIEENPFPPGMGQGWRPYSPIEVGGVVGIVGDGTVANCYSTGQVLGVYNIGGIAGDVVKGSVKNCVALNSIVYVENRYGYLGGRIKGIGQSGEYTPSAERGDEYSLSDNFAFRYMDGSFPDITGATTVNGADITIEKITAKGSVLDTLFPTKNGWTKESGKLPGLFGKAVDIPNHLFKSDAIVSHEREVPVGDNLNKAAVDVTAPPNRLTAKFSVGPNPAGKQFGTVNFYFRDNGIKDGALTIYDASGNVINKVKIKDRYSYSVASTQERRNVGSWDLRDKKGRHVPDGTYLIRGTITASNGKSEKVSAVVGVAAQR